MYLLSLHILAFSAFWALNYNLLCCKTEFLKQFLLRLCQAYASMGSQVEAALKEGGLFIEYCFKDWIDRARRFFVQGREKEDI